jgi:GrpB-like predicted nucleotidyltransferase (UPF0157 family)
MAAPLTSDKRPVELVAHDPSWADQAAREGVRLSIAIGDALILVEHMGSTAIPGIAAKPIIDLFPVVTSLEALALKRPAIEALGYEWWGENGVPGRRYCTRDEKGVRLFHVHCFEANSPELLKHRTFRDYLRANTREAYAYEHEKRMAAAEHPDDSLAYNDAKAAWIVACQARAAQWAANRIN